MGARFVCDRGSSHIRTQAALLQEEHQHWGWPLMPVDPRIIEREEAEYAEADCVTVCPTGASYKREDGIVLVNQDQCMGCNLCTWACPYGARELDTASGTVKKCTLCADRIDDTLLPPQDRQPACVLACPAHARHFGDFDDPQSLVSQLVAERGGVTMLPALGYQPVNRYLPPRNAPKVSVMTTPDSASLMHKVSGWINKMIER